jgi:hypothetical protein
MSDEHTNVGPSSWRDVYSLVQDVEERLSAKVDAVELRLQTRMDSQSLERRGIANDFEVRLRVVEREQLVNKQADSTSKTALGVVARVATIILSIIAILVSIVTLVVK